MFDLSAFQFSELHTVDESSFSVKPKTGSVKNEAASMSDSKGSKGTLAELAKDRAALRAAAQALAATIVPPGQISWDEANGYMARIANLFSGEPRVDVELSLAIWGSVNGVGGEDDFGTKPAIVVGSTTVAATDVFGKIVPTGVQGRARQFMSAYFEKDMPAVLDAFPELHDMLAPRVAKAGLNKGQTLQVIDFVKGVTSSTVGLSGDRAAAKARLVSLKSTSGRSPGGAPPPAVTEVLSGGSSNRYQEPHSSLY